jgi:hypothetical protein
MEKPFNVQSEWGADPCRTIAAWFDGPLPNRDLPDIHGWLSPVTATSMSGGYELLGWRNIRKAFLPPYDAETGHRHTDDTARKLVHPQRPECDFIKYVRGGIPATMVASVEAFALRCAQQTKRGKQRRTGHMTTCVSSGSVLSEPIWKTK